ncbi:MAG: hypothetical protein WC533_03490 [Candidatus Pacearchaeota archaeon]
MTNSIKQNKEVIMIFMIAVLFAVLLSNNNYFTQKYLQNGLNSILLPVFGVLLGSLVTAYTLIIAFNNQIPNRVKETKAYKRTNKHFLLTLCSLLLVLITSLLFYFFDGWIIMFTNLFLSIFSFLMFFLLICIIYQLVKIVIRP